MAVWSLRMLWFAFILLSLSYWKQRPSFSPCHTGRCDLLSFYYLCRTGNNEREGAAYFAELWFAFILLSLSYWKQPPSFFKGAFASCDLLSFYYLCRTGNNSDLCFFVVKLLWFAFILLSLSYWKQRPNPQRHPRCSCDLLSFYYLCRTGNNFTTEEVRKSLVVICFHFTIFVVLETTPLILQGRICELWFAFILLSLSYWKQLCVQLYPPRLGCDLLSFYYLCRTGNNYCVVRPLPAPVVICFHFTIFVVLETT